MALAYPDEELLLDEVGDYEVLERPEELLSLQRKSSDLKATSKKSNSDSAKKSSLLKESKPTDRSKERKHGRKTISSKSKSLLKSSLSSKTTLRKGNSGELDTKFDVLLKHAKSSLAKHRSSKASRKESTNQTDFKANSGEDGSKQNDSSILGMMGEPAITPQQRYQVLVARDNAIRSNDAKQGTTKKHKVIGCCPDMCPEKERYSRIAKNCLSALEMKTVFDKVATSRDANHRFMVKEYSRSSADQQAPLPNELRPISVLMFTMDYLICNIMDIPLDNVTLSDWYDFIWNRTRSIRKDITQQQLCDISCVDIIEKCVRFHIHCAEALSEEDTSIFDPKINNENLNKCLQTLKHMYHDLLSKGIECPNEAEFRSYDILLSLTEGETLRLIKDIRKELLNNPTIQRAFNAAVALKSNNYVRFFKIIEKADYLSSCILHRYIMEARIDALQVIVRAYSTHHNASMYPTSNLVRDLKFENTTEACEFCRSHNLDANEDCITIDRRQFTKFASGLSLSRSYLLVGSKKTESLGQIINRGQLPANPLSWYQPHNSFDEKNLLKNETLVTSVMNVPEELPDNEQKYTTMEKKEEFYDQDDVYMEDLSNEIQPLSDIPAPVPTTVQNNSQSFGYKIKDADIGDLEKARKYLLNKISKIQHLSNEKIKKLKSTASKVSHKTDKERFSHSKSHKSILNSNDSDIVQPEQNSFKPEVITSQENTSQAAVGLKISQVFGHKTVESVKYNDLVSKPTGDIFSTSVSKLSKVEENVLTTEVLSQSTPVSESGFFSEVCGSQSSGFHSTFASSLFPKVTVCSEIKESSNSPFQMSPVPSSSVQFFFGSQSLSDEKTSTIQEEHKSIEDNLPLPSATQTSIRPVTKDAEVLELPAEDMNTTMSSELSSEEIEELKEKQRAAELEAAFEDLVEDICNQCIEENVSSICEDALQDERMRLAEIEDECEIIRGYLARKTFAKWKLFSERKRHRRQMQNSTFCSPWQSMLLSSPYFVTGVVSPIVAYKKYCALSHSAAQKIKQYRDIPPGWEEFKPREIWNLSKSNTLSPSYFGKSGLLYFFKLCIIFPAECYCSDGGIFFDWIRTKFSLSQNPRSDWVYSNSIQLNDNKTFVNITAIQVGSNMASNFKEVMDGISGMILCMPSFSKSEDEILFLKDFSSFLDSDALLFPYPLYAFFLDSLQNFENVLSFLNEKQDAVFFNHMQTKQLVDITNFSKNSRELLDAVDWLIIKKKSFPVLQKYDIKHYLEDSFIFAFNILYCKIALEEFQCLKQMPSHIIDFYNLVVNFRSSILCSGYLQRILLSWPPKELIQLYPDIDFINKRNQLMCKEKLKSLCLPKFTNHPNNMESLWLYVNEVALHAPKSKDMLFIKIENSLKNSKSSCIDWLNVTNICASHLLFAQELLDSNESLFIHCVKEDLENFDCDEFWHAVAADNRKLTLEKIKRKNTYSFKSSEKKFKSDVILEESFCDNVLYEEENSVSHLPDALDLIRDQQRNKFDHLETVLAQQNEESDAFLKQLDESIIAGNASSNGYYFDGEKDDFNQDAVNSGTDILASESEISFPDTHVPQLISSLDSLDSRSSIHTGIEWLDMSLRNKSSAGTSSFSSLAAKLNELKYNVQKSNILEDHFSQLLLKQV